MRVHAIYKHTAFTTGDPQNKNQAGYTCRITSIEREDNKSIEIIGEHEEGRNDEDVVGVVFQNKVLKRIPRGLGHKFKNLQFLQLVRCHIETVRMDDFLELTGLKGLWMDENFITLLPDDLFSNSQGIQILSFYKNKLKYIGENVLKPLKNLKRANFLGNTMIDYSYDYDPQQLRQLNVEIATKCTMPGKIGLTPSPSTNQNVLNDLRIRVSSLETTVKNLEFEINTKTAQITQMQEVIDDLNQKFNVLEEKFGMFY